MQLNNIEYTSFEMRFSIKNGNEKKLRTILKNGFNPNIDISLSKDKRAFSSLIFALGMASLPKENLELKKTIKIVCILLN